MESATIESQGILFTILLAIGVVFVPYGVRSAFHYAWRDPRREFLKKVVVSLGAEDVEVDVDVEARLRVEEDSAEIRWQLPQELMATQPEVQSKLEDIDEEHGPLFQLAYWYTKWAYLLSLASGLIAVVITIFGIVGIAQSWPVTPLETGLLCGVMVALGGSTWAVRSRCNGAVIELNYGPDGRIVF